MLKTVVVPQLQFFVGRFFPVVAQRLITLDQTALTILGTPQLQFFDQLVVVPVLVLSRRKLWRLRSCSALTRALTFLS